MSIENYIIEDGLDFYKEINKGIEQYDSQEEQENVFKCLITNQDLQEDYVTLDCGHMYNYNAIYKDIYNHKKVFNSLERNHLKTLEIRCPYCRNIQKKLLPSNEGYPDIHGVNYIDTSMSTSLKGEVTPKKKLYNIGVCSYFIETQTKMGIPQLDLCSNHLVKWLPDDCNYYCKEHARKIRAKIKKQNNSSIKYNINSLESDIPSLSELIINNINQIEENIVLGVVDLNNQEGCSAILSYGKNKNNPCGSKVYKDGMCKRHYNLKNKKNNIK